jgi:hypothetical protein
MHFYPADHILSTVERVFRVTRQEITGPRRYQNLANARRCAAYFLSIAGNRSNEQIAKLLSRSPSWASQQRWHYHDAVSVDKTMEAQAVAVYGALAGRVAA